MTPTMRLPFSISLFTLSFCLFFLFGVDLSCRQCRPAWGDVPVGGIISCAIERCDIRNVENLLTENSVVESELKKLVGFAFKHGYLCNDEDKAMCLQKTEKGDYRTIKRLSAVAYFLLFAGRPYVYKIEFVDETITFISLDQDVPHNLIDQENWEKYRQIEKVIIEQTIIRDGEISLITGSSMRLDGHPDFLFKNKYVETKDNTLIHAETMTLEVGMEATTMLRNYIEEMLEYLRKIYT